MPLPAHARQANQKAKILNSFILTQSKETPTNIIYELFELSFIETVGILWGVNDFVQTASCTQLHDDHLVLVLHLHVTQPIMKRMYAMREGVAMPDLVATMNADGLKYRRHNAVRTHIQGLHTMKSLGEVRT